MRNPRYLGILLRYTFRRINNEHDNVRPFHRCHSPDDHIPFQLFFDFVFPPQTGRVDEDIFFSTISDFRIDRIPRRTRDIGYDKPIFPNQLIDDGRFSHIGLPDDGNPRPLIFFLFLRLLLIEMRRNFIQQITDTLLIGGRNGKRLPDAKIIELIYIHHVFLVTVYFIDGKHDRLTAAAQHIRHFGIRIHKSLFDIHHKNNDVRSVNRNLRLLTHLAQNNVFTLRFDTARINQGKTHVKPCDIGIDPVARNTRRIFYNRYIVSCQCVEQRGFPHIGPANYRHDRPGFPLSHDNLSPFSSFGLPAMPPSAAQTINGRMYAFCTLPCEKDLQRKS